MSRRPQRLTSIQKSSNLINIRFWATEQASTMLHGIDPVFAISGLAVGLLVGFTGVGGGSLMTPLLVLAFGVHPATAVGTDLLYAGVTKISGGAVHAYHGSVDWRITRRLAYGSVPAALLSLAAARASRVVLQGERRDHQHDAWNRADHDCGHAYFPQGAARPPGAAHGRRERADGRRSHRRARRGSRRAW